jgi:hypothetical protein
VQALYQLLLDRQGDAAEVSPWTGSLSQMSRPGVALAILQSQEFRTDLFEAYYNILLHRPGSATEVEGLLRSGLDARTGRIALEGSPEFYSNG